MREVDKTWLQKEAPFLDWAVFMEETLGEEVEQVAIFSYSYLGLACSCRWCSPTPPTCVLPPTY